MTLSLKSSQKGPGGAPGRHSTWVQGSPPRNRYVPFWMRFVGIYRYLETHFYSLSFFMTRKGHQKLERWTQAAEEAFQSLSNSPVLCNPVLCKLFLVHMHTTRNKLVATVSKGFKRRSTHHILKSSVCLKEILFYLDTVNKNSSQKKLPYKQLQMFSTLWSMGYYPNCCY